MARSMTVQERENEIRKISDVMNWPQMHLPVVNLHDETFERRVGIILHTTEHPYDVFEVNQFHMKPVIEALKTGEKPDCIIHHYDSFEAVVNDGWVGD